VVGGGGGWRYYAVVGTVSYAYSVFLLDKRSGTELKVNLGQMKIQRLQTCHAATNMENNF